MAIFLRRFEVPANSVGFLYRKNRLQRRLEPGIYYRIDPLILRWFSVFVLPATPVWAEVRNQEVLAKDNVAFRFSYSISFMITEPEKFIAQSSLQMPYPGVLAAQAHQLVTLHSQVVLRERITALNSNEINDKRTELLSGCLEELNSKLQPLGLAAAEVLLRDLTFPKRIQDLFALSLESKIRAQADLENARTAVATARALKNAAEMLKDEPQVQFLQLLETISKIAATGKHTFVIGDPRSITAKS